MIHCYHDIVKMAHAHTEFIYLSFILKTKASKNSMKINIESGEVTYRTLVRVKGRHIDR